MENLFVTCSSGMEELLCEELNEMGFTVESGFRGAYVNNSSMEAVYRINYCSRLAGRVLLPLARFRCHDRVSLYRGCETLDWTTYIPHGKSFAIDANVSHQELRNSLFAAQVMKDAICDQFRDKTSQRPNVDPKNPDVQLNLFIRHDQAIISYDTSRLSLHKRGYRQESVEAPLQESLAAAILRIAGYQGNEVLLDLCCGSGTFLTEAALIATRTPPGFLRTQWGFMLLPQFSQEDWVKVKGKADQQRIPLPKGLISGCDINRDAARISKINLKAAGFSSYVEVFHTDYRQFTPSVAPNFVIVNPPHGRRLSEVDTLKPLYRSIGDFLKRMTAKPAKGFVFSGSPELSKEVGLAAKRRHVIDNNGVESRLLEFDLY